MYIINTVSLIRTFHLSEQNFEPMNQRGSDKRGCTVSPSELADSTGGMFSIQWPKKCSVTDIMVQTINCTFPTTSMKGLGYSSY